MEMKQNNLKLSVMSRPFLDFCCVLLVISFASILFSAVSLAIMENQPESSYSNAEAVLEWIGIISSFLFLFCSIPLWLFAIKIYFKTIKNRSLLGNCYYLVILLGFSWAAGLITYILKRKQLKIDEMAVTHI